MMITTMAKEAAMDSQVGGPLPHVLAVPSLQQQQPQRLHYVRHHLRQTKTLALKSPKGFGPPSPSRSSSADGAPLNSSSQKQKRKQKNENGLENEDDDEDDDEVPQIVTDRMLKRIGVSVGIPLTAGVLFFPFFWYLKIKLKVDVPEWLPLLVSGLCFGSSGIGITYGIISTSWDPLREGSFWGWKEAEANWPVFFQSLQPKQGRK